MDRTIPKKNTLDKWTNQRGLLKIKNRKLVCSICIKYQEKLSIFSAATNAFINGSDNYRMSALKDHSTSKILKQACVENEIQKGKERGGKRAPKPMKITIPISSPLLQGFNRMKEGEEKSLIKLFEIAYLIAIRGRPLTNFSNLVKSEKLHSIKFLKKYKNWVACQDFISATGDYFFSEFVRSKLECTNFIGIWNDRTIDAATIEQEVLYVTFLDPDTYKPCLTFLKVAELESQDTQGLKKVIYNSFKKINLEKVLSKIVFLESHGTSMNSGMKSGSISLLKKDYEWISFIWCFLHCLELGLKESLNEFIKPLNQSLIHLYYWYKKLSKKCDS